MFFILWSCLDNLSWSGIDIKGYLRMDRPIFNNSSLPFPKSRQSPGLAEETNNDWLIFFAFYFWYGNYHFRGWWVKRSGTISFQAHYLDALDRREHPSSAQWISIPISFSLPCWFQKKRNVSWSLGKTVVVSPKLQLPYSRITVPVHSTLNFSIRHHNTSNNLAFFPLLHQIGAKHF